MFYIKKTSGKNRVGVNIRCNKDEGGGSDRIIAVKLILEAST